MTSKQLSKQQKEQNQQKTAEFHNELSNWKSNGTVTSWNRLWELVHDVCEALCKQKCRGLIVRDLDDIIMDCTIECMKDLKNGKVPEYLVTWCNFRVLKIMYNKNKQFNDRLYSLEYLNEIGATYEESISEVL